MASIQKWFSDGVTRLRHPFSLPEEVGLDLGWEISNEMSFSSLIQHLTQTKKPPARLKKFMPREKVLETFSHALRAEEFHRKVIISYQFKQGCVEFELSFDEQDRLRRLRMQAPDIKSDYGHEIVLLRENENVL